MEEHKGMESTSLAGTNEAIKAEKNNSVPDDNAEYAQQDQGLNDEVEEDDDVGNIIMCQRGCKIQFPNYLVMRDHMDKYHPDMGFSAPALSTKLPEPNNEKTPKQLQKVIKEIIWESDGKRKFQCQLCSKIYSTKRSCSNHLMNMHSGVSNEIKESTGIQTDLSCGDGMEAGSRETSQMAQSNDKVDEIFTEDELTFVEGLKQRVCKVTIDGKIKWQCDFCDMQFTKKFACSTHILNLHSNIEKECPICDKKVQGYQKFKYHKANCQKRSVNSNHSGSRIEDKEETGPLISQERIHHPEIENYQMVESQERNISPTFQEGKLSQEPPMPEGQESKSDTSHVGKRRRLSSLNEDMPYKLLVEALENVSKPKNKNFRCKLCPEKTTRWSSGLRDHIEKMHLNVTYSCEICLLAFPLYSKYLYHKRHCEERSQEELSNTSSLQRSHKTDPHKSSESTEKCEVSCTECSEEFSTEEKLNLHLSEHHNLIASYKCANCTLTFILVKQLVDHFRMEHGDEESFYEMNLSDEEGENEDINIEGSDTELAHDSEAQVLYNSDFEMEDEETEELIGDILHHEDEQNEIETPHSPDAPSNKLRSFQDSDDDFEPSDEDDESSLSDQEYKPNSVKMIKPKKDTFSQSQLENEFEDLEADIAPSVVMIDRKKVS